MTVGMYDDGSPGEIFVTMAKEGSVVSGLMDSFATAISMSLQYGVPLKVLCDKFSHTRFEPSGFTGNPDIPIAKSISDYLFRWLALKFLPSEDGATLSSTTPALTPGTAPAAQSRASSAMLEARAALPAARTNGVHADGPVAVTHTRETDAPPCPTCGSITVRNGACYKCVNCGSTTGCS
jgi:ribonucleoside-diphosphate reductase alpha chain